MKDPFKNLLFDVNSLGSPARFSRPSLWKTGLLTLTAAMMLLSGSAQAQWLSGYDYRKSLGINGGAGAGIGYQVQVRVGESSGSAGFDFHLAGNALNFPNDVRFTDDDGTTQLSHWLDSSTGVAPNRTATFLVKVNDNLDSSQSIFTYYRKSADVSGSSGATFTFFDDFPGAAIDGAKWGIDNATGWSVSGGELRGSNSNGRIRSLATFGSGVILETKYRTISRPFNGNMVLGFYPNTGSRFGWMNTYGSDAMWNNTWVNNIGPECNVPVIARITAKATTVDLYVYRQDTGAVWHNRPNETNTVVNGRIALGQRYDNSATNQTYEAYWDWVRVRKYTATAPTLGAVGAEVADAPTVTLVSPVNGSQVGTGASAFASATVSAGMPPITVEFFKTYNGGASVSVGTDNTEPYSVDLGVLADGNYTISATVTDSATPTPRTANSATHNFTVASDTTPPSPSPMTFAVAPVAISANSIRMAAMTATDAASSPVQYYFENTTNVTNSGWISSPTWTDSGLTLGVTYDYRVKARDTAVPANETSFSAVSSIATSVLPARAITFINPGFEIPILSDGSSTIALPGWLPIGDVGVASAWNPAVTFYTAEAPEGRNIGDVYLCHAYSGFSQILQGSEGQFQADTSYELKLNVGRNLLDPYDGYIIQLVANGVVLAQDDNSRAPAAGSFVEASLRYTYNGALHANLVGFPLEIRLLTKGLAGGLGDVGFDDVKLTYTTSNPVAIHGGPYRLSKDAPLSLNGSASLPSTGATITTYEWDLDSRNDNLGFTANLTGAAPVAIPYTTLTSVYAMGLGANTIRLRVTDNVGQSVISPTTVTLFSRHIYIGPDTSNGNTERWNNTSQWDVATAPSGLVDVVIPSNKFVPVLSSLTPSYTGNLTLGANSQISLGWSTSSDDVLNALGKPGTSVITMNSGSSINFRIGTTPYIPGIALAGNASVILGSSTQPGAQASFNYPITGAYRLTFYGNSQGSCVANLNAPNTFNEIYTSTMPYSDGGVTIAGNAPGSLGIGNLTFDALSGGGNSCLLVINAGDSMADTATLSMSGNSANKITMNANDTIAGLIINGAQMPAGTYGSNSSNATFKQTWMAGTGVLTVAQGQGNIWDINGAVAGAGGASPSGNWDSGTANWSNSTTGAAATGSWVTGRTAVFSAGSDATGPYTVTVGDSNAISITNVMATTVTGNSGTANMNANVANWALSGGNAVVVLFSGKNVSAFSVTYAGVPMTVASFKDANNVYNGIAYILDPAATTGNIVMTGTYGLVAGNNNILRYAYRVMSLSNVASVGTLQTRNSAGTLTYSTSVNNSYVFGVAANNNWQSTYTVSSTGNASNILYQGNPGYYNALLAHGPVINAGSSTDTYSGAITGAITLPFNAKTTANPALPGAGQKIAGLTFEEGAVTISGSKLELQTNSQFASSPGVTGTISSQITGVSTSGVSKKGTGTVVLSNSTNSYTGTTTIDNGILRLGTSNALPNTVVSIAGDVPGATATLDLNGFSNAVAGLALGGSTNTSGASITTGAGTLTLSGNVLFNSVNSPLGATVFGNFSLGSSTRTFDIKDSPTAANDLAVSAVMSGTGGLTKIGFGSLLLSGNNTYTGATTVSGGLLVLSGADNSAATGSITIQSNAAIRFESPASINGSGQNVTVQSGGLACFGSSFGGGNIPTTLTGRINPASTGVIAADNFGSAAFNFSGLNVYLGALNDVTYTGTLTPNAGTYRIGGGVGTIQLSGLNALTGSGSLLVGGSVVITNSNSFSGATTIGTSGRLQLGAGGTLGSLVSTTLTNSGILAFNRSNTLTQGTDFWSSLSGTGVVEKSGSGMLILNVANTYSGGTNLLAGILRLDHASAIGSGPLVIYSGALDVSGALTLASNNLITLGGSFDFGGTANLHMGTGGVNVTGDHTITLNGTNKSLTFGGVMTNISGRDQTLTANGAGNTLVLSGYKFSSNIYDTQVALTIGGSADVSISGAVDDWSIDENDVRLGSLTKIGTGKLTLSGNNNYTGNTIVAGGVLHLANGSQLSPIFVNGGGTLAFTLETPIMSTKKLTLRDGHKIRVFGTPTLDTYTLMIAESVVGGAPMLETPIPHYFLEIAGNELRLTKNDITPPELVDIVNDQGEGANVGPISLGSSVTYTVTFNEDIDQATVTAVDFTNVAATTPASFNIGTIMEISPGVFTVQVTPTTAGNLRLSIPVAADIRDVIGNILDNDPALVDGATINIVDTSTNWLISTDILDDQGGAAVNYGNLVIYTIYFGRDVDHTTVDATDFGNAGTSALTIGTITEISPGVVTVHVTPTAPGTLQLQVNAGAVLKDASDISLNTTSPIPDDTTLAVNDGTPPTLASSSIVDNKGGGAAAINLPVIYTVTFNEDMDDSTVTADDFVDAGTSSALIGAVTEIAPGVFTVEATPTTAGTLRLEVLLGAVLKDASGNSLDTQLGILDDTTLTVDAILPTLVSTNIVDNKSGGPITVGAQVTYAVTFSEDMDASSVTVADFGNASATAVNIVSVAETVTPGVFNVIATPTAAGTLRLRINQDAVLKDVAGNSLNTTTAIADDTIITVDGALPTLAGNNIVDNKGGGPVAMNTMVTYTVTFSEDMDASSVTAADFGNAAAGSSTINFGAITEISLGVFTVQVTPTTIGNLQLKVNANAVIKDLAGNNLNTTSAILDDTTIYVDGAAPTLTGSFIVDNKGGAAVAVGTLVTYTVTFSEDMDASTVTGADFGNASGTAVTIGAVTETATPGVFTVQATPTATGTLRLQVNAGASLKDVVGNSLNTTSAIVDNTTLAVDGTVPTLASTAIVDNKGGARIMPNTPVLYTVTFSEDMNASTVTGADFGNASGTAVTIGAVTETATPGVFTVQATPTAVGTLQLQVNQNAELKDVAGNNLNTTSAILDNTTITVENTAPTLAATDIVDNKAGGLVAANSQVTYTVTFSEDMDASTVTTVDFGNASGTAVTIVSVAETATPGVFTVVVTPTAGGTLRLQVKALAELKDVAGNSLNTATAIFDNTILTVDGALPTLASTNIVDNKGGGPVLMGAAVTYTVTFSEDMDASTVSSLDFENAGSSTVVISAVTESSPGVFTLSVTPNTIGTLQLKVIAGASIKDVAGNSLNTTSAILDDTTISVDGAAPTLTGAFIVDNKGGAPILPNTVVTYTVTFSEDMDAGTVTIADFGNASVTPVTILSVAEAAPGVFSVQAKPTSGGTLQLRVNQNAILKDVAGNSLNTAAAIVDNTTLTVDGTLPTLPVTSIVDNKSGATILPNTVVTYTVTFSEDMDASTVNAADFGNASGTAVTIISVVETTTPGVFTVQAKPTTGGTLRLQVNSGAILKDVVGNSLNTASAILDNTTITVDGTLPTLASTAIVDDKGGATIAKNTVVTYTVTFSENMDASTVNALDFANASGTAATIGAITATTPKVFSIKVTPTAGGTLRLQVKAGAVIKDAAGNSLNTVSTILDDTTLTVDGTVPTLPVTAIVDDKSGAPITVNTVVTYAVSFSEDMNASTVTVDDFGNVSTTPVTIVSVAETATPGVFTVQAKPTASGTLRLKVNTGAVLQDVAGNKVNTTSAILDDTTLTVDGTPPTLGAAAIVDDKSGARILPNTMVTYTLTFSENMDASTVAAIDFGNVSTTPVTINSVTATTPKVFSVKVTPTAAGTLRLKVKAGAVLKDVAGNNLNTASAILDDTTITVDGTPPTLAAASIVDNKGGVAIARNTLVTYTVTFSEDMDATSVAAADFSNAGTSSITFGTVTATSSKAFSVKVTPTTAGTLRLQVKVGAVLKDVAGNSMITTSAIADDTTITVNAALSAVVDKSIADTSETYYTTDPVDGLKYLTMVIHKAPGTESQPRTIEVSGNLTDWFSGSKHTTVLTDDANILKVRDNTPVTGDGKRYIRLKP